MLIELKVRLMHLSFVSASSLSCWSARIRAIAGLRFARADQNVSMEVVRLKVWLTHSTRSAFSTVSC